MHHVLSWAFLLDLFFLFVDLFIYLYHIFFSLFMFLQLRDLIPKKFYRKPPQLFICVTISLRQLYKLRTLHLIWKIANSVQCRILKFLTKTETIEKTVVLVPMSALNKNFIVLNKKKVKKHNHNPQDIYICKFFSFSYIRPFCSFVCVLLRRYVLFPIPC